MKYLMLFSLLFCSLYLHAQEQLLVVNKDGNDLSIIDSKSYKVLQTITTGHGPHEVAVTPNQQRAIVTNYGYGCGQRAGRSLTVVNLKDYTSYEIDLGPHRSPHGVYALSDNKTVAITVECDDALILVDIEQKKVILSVATQANVSHMVVLSKDENLAFVANIGSGSVSVIDLEKGELIKNIKTGSGAEGIDLAKDGKTLWVSNRSDDSISVIDVHSLSVVDTIKVAQMPIRIKIHPTRDLALVSNAKSATLAIINTQNLKVLEQLSMTNNEIKDSGNVFRNGPVPIGLVYSLDGKYAFVANTNVDEIRRINLNNNSVDKVFSAGKRPDGLAVVEVRE